MRSASVHRSKDSDISDPLSCYLREIRAYPLLDHAEELDLSERTRAGDRNAMERLVCANLRFVVSVAKRFQNQGVPLSGLINEGNLGLVRAAEKYDGSQGVKFVSYAVWWIKRAIMQALADHGRAVRVPLDRSMRRWTSAKGESCWTTCRPTSTSSKRISPKRRAPHRWSRQWVA